MARMVLMNELITSLEKGEIVVGVFLDFSKSFDTIDHHILLSTLEQYGIRSNALSGFLTDRKQHVTYNGTISPTKAIRCGEPQGYILGPMICIWCVAIVLQYCSLMIQICSLVVLTWILCRIC